MLSAATRQPNGASLATMASSSPVATARRRPNIVVFVLLLVTTMFGMWLFFRSLPSVERCVHDDALCEVAASLPLVRVAVHVTLSCFARL